MREHIERGDGHTAAAAPDAHRQLVVAVAVHVVRERLRGHHDGGRRVPEFVWAGGRGPASSLPPSALPSSTASRALPLRDLAQRGDKARRYAYWATSSASAAFPRYAYSYAASRR
ncbi:MAG: hypothetical protein ACM30G_16810 [Micromonosporaceae bacterium]